MKQCTHCSAANADEAFGCKVCGCRTFYLSRSTGLKRKPNSILDEFRRAFSARSTRVLLCVCLAALGGEVIWQQLRLTKTRNELASEQKSILADHAAAMAEQDRAFQARLEREEKEHQALIHNVAWLSGSLARERHEKEWDLRISHDPRFTKSALETNLLTIEKLGRDSTVAAKTALETIAQMASPKDSRVEVDADGDGFRVRVAFLMSRLSSHEAGAVTKHHNTAAMRSEIRELSAHLLADLYGNCGSRGIKSISVTCNHTLRQTALPANATAEERTLLFQQAKPIPARLYRMSLDQPSAQRVVDWRRVSISRVSELATVEYDGLTHLTITADKLVDQNQQDAAGELQF